MAKGVSKGQDWKLADISAMWEAHATNSLAEQSERLVKLFAALGDPTRMELVLLAYAQELTAGDMTATLDLASSTVSYHLRTLVRAGVLAERQRGRERWYRVRPEAAAVLAAAAI